ncbi:50S ribosomal protein L7/L12 [bacterium AB1]|nr:50S ribosomal protein L7/L12 [bacterium AB1]
MSDKIKNILQMLLDLTVGELSDLLKEFSTHMGVSVQEMFAVGSAPSNDSSNDQEVDDKPATYKIIIKSLGTATKMSLIKRLRVLFPDLSVMEAKQKSEALPLIVKTNLPASEKDILMKELTEEGYEVVSEKE